MNTPEIDALGLAHEALRALVKRKRKDDHVADTLGVVVMRAVEEAEELQAAGADVIAVAAGLERVVRDTWPRGREEAWRYLCEECRDYGWRLHRCPGDATCGRPHRHAEHDYVEPCWCANGERVKPKQKRASDELEAVGKVSKPTRFGR